MMASSSGYSGLNAWATARMADQSSSARAASRSGFDVNPCSARTRATASPDTPVAARCRRAAHWWSTRPVTTIRWYSLGYSIPPACPCACTAASRLVGLLGSWVTRPAERCQQPPQPDLFRYPLAQTVQAGAVRRQPRLQVGDKLRTVERPGVGGGLGRVPGEQLRPPFEPLVEEPGIRVDATTQGLAKDKVRVAMPLVLSPSEEVVLELMPAPEGVDEAQPCRHAAGLAPDVQGGGHGDDRRGRLAGGRQLEPVDVGVPRQTIGQRRLGRSCPGAPEGVPEGMVEGVQALIGKLELGMEIGGGGEQAELRPVGVGVEGVVDQPHVEIPADGRADKERQDLRGQAGRGPDGKVDQRVGIEGGEGGFRPWAQDLPHPAVQLPRECGGAAMGVGRERPPLGAYRSHHLRPREGVPVHGKAAPWVRATPIAWLWVVMASASSLPSAPRRPS